MKTILFDLDSTLLDHFRAIHLAIAHAQRALDLEASSYETVRSTVGGGLKRTLHHLVGAENVDAAIPHFRDHFEQVMFDEAEMLPGAIWLLESLKARGMQLAVFTNKLGDHSRAIVQHFQIDQLLDATIGGDDTPFCKPSPEFSQHALTTLAADPKETLLIGDSPFDFLAAEAGGFKSYLVATGSHSVEQLQTETSAAGIYQDLYGLAHDLFQLEPETTCSQ